MIDSEERIFNSYALESTLNFKNRNWVWTRIENLDKDRTLLYGEETPVGRVQAYSFGYERDIFRTPPWANIGSRLSIHDVWIDRGDEDGVRQQPEIVRHVPAPSTCRKHGAHMRAMHGH